MKRSILLLLTWQTFIDRTYSLCFQLTANICLYSKSVILKTSDSISNFVLNISPKCKYMSLRFYNQFGDLFLHFSRTKFVKIVSKTRGWLKTRCSCKLYLLSKVYIPIFYQKIECIALYGATRHIHIVYTTASALCNSIVHCLRSVAYENNISWTPTDYVARVWV